MRETLDQYDRNERSLLLFFETRLVDYQGRVASIHMNAEDMVIAEKFMSEGLIQFGRLGWNVIESFKELGLTNRHTHWVRFSELAWKLSAEERRARSERMLARDYEKLEAEKTANRNA
jgi:hypothetical protein